METTIRLTGTLDPRDSWTADNDTCTIALSLGVLSTRSTFLLLREAFYGATRFDEFVSRTGLSSPSASARLRELVENGLLQFEPYKDEGQRTRNGYHLTDKGAELLPVLVGLMQWGNRWLSDSGGPAELHHHGCGERVTAELRCAAGHEVDIGELELSPVR
jgi:DNA-binding HxlR family transcriptional regulator